MEPDKETAREQNEQQLITKLTKRGMNVKIDGNININTFITAGTLLVSVSLAYAALDKRITIIEQVQVDKLARVERELQDVRKELKEITALLTPYRRP
jgi:hypothetical protein